MDKKILFLILLGLLTSVAVDVDHLLLTGGGLNIRCMALGFLSLTSKEAMDCRAHGGFSYAILHEWYVGLFLFSFLAMYLVVMKS